jgi:protein-tyrosine phosphatase
VRGWCLPVHDGDGHATTAAEYRILLVCLGNICRSPTAEAALRDELARAGLAGRVEVDSAGTGAWHVGKPPDPRMIDAGRTLGLVLGGAARQVAIEDFDLFDLVLAMDDRNRADLVALAPDVAAGRKVRLFREFDADADPDHLDVPDPYYGGPEGFTQVVELVRAAARGVVAHVRQELAPPAPSQ